MAREIGEQMIIAEWLFVETVDDLRRRCQEPGDRSRYELLGIAPLLRKLLLDATPLLQTVQIVRPEVSVAFRIRPWSPVGRGLEQAGLERHLGLGGEELVGGPDDSAITSLEEFKHTIVGIADGSDLTVRGIIRYYAHVEGGVHFGSPREPGEPALGGMTPLLLGHSTGQIQILAHLGRIVVNALGPMRRSILERPTIHSLWHHKNEQGFYAGHWTTEYLTQG